MAATVEQFGDASRLRVREMPVPQPRAGQIVVQVAEYAVAIPAAPTLQAFRLVDIAAAHHHVEQRCAGRAVLLPSLPLT